MKNKIRIPIVIFLLVVLWFTLISSFIDIFRLSSGIADMQDSYSGIELSNSLLFFNLNNGLRLEGIQIVIAGGFLLLYFSKKGR